MKSGVKEETSGVEDELVWYVAYGSNLSEERFRRYLDGCRDRSDSRRWAAVMVAHRLVFARRSSPWGGGGVAFLDPLPDPTACTRGRAWLLTLEQFADILAQECGLPVGSIAAPSFEGAVPTLEGGCVVAVPGHWYGCAVPLGWRDGWPLVTFTDEAAGDLVPNPPGAAYRAVIAQGLIESHGLSPDEADTYIARLSF